jgi:mannose-6-phosphate isomerase-like protein (cupin superfamily)
MSEVQIIVPADVAPTINPNSPEHVSGRQVHRRILDFTRGGPANLDVGYNQSKAGIDVMTPYAYTKDEYCYNAAGRVRAESDGTPRDVVTGMFMWRPAGAATQRITVLEDYISICAFGPARTDGWSHRLPEDQVGRWDGPPDQKPRVQFKAVADVPPSDFRDLEMVAGEGVHRRVFDTPRMEVSHTMLKAGATLTGRPREREDIYWLESGAVTVSVAGASKPLGKREFLRVPAGATLEKLVADMPSTLIRWSAPASVEN